MIWWLTILILCVEQVRLVQSEKVIRITPRVEAHLQFLHGLETRGDIKVDFWKGPSRLFQTVDIGVSDYDFITLSSLLKNEGIQFKVQIDDVQKLIKEELEPVGATRGVDGFDGSGGGGNGGGSSDWHSKYHNLEEIHSKLDVVKGSYGKLTTIISLGRSHENRSMSAIKISGKPSLHKPVFFIQCGIHAREWISPATCMYIIDQMTQKYLTDDAVTEMLDTIDFVILPVLNVDGYKYTWGGAGQRLWRKNRRPHNANCFGVDLNRNWGHVWGGEGASPNECDETYRGSSAFSEVETSNVRSYLEGLHSDGKLKGFIDFHAYSQMWFIPWGYTSVDTPDHAEQMRVAKIAAEALKNKHGTRFQYGSSAALLYPAAGGSDDWTYGKLGVKYSFSVELRDEGRYGFLLPPDQIIPTGEETFEGLKALVKAIGV